MSSVYSVHSVNYAEGPKWLPGEELAATAFIAMTFLLVIEINIAIHYVFSLRRGVYFWAMQIGSLGCAVDGIALSIRHLVPNATRVWPLYTVMATLGWAVYTVAQLMILYSRLHLVLQNPRVQLAVYRAIWIVSPILILTDWVTTWPAYNPRTSENWSSAEAIVERICQLGFSSLEATINVIYAAAIVRVFKSRVNVRQRLVMRDLVYVNAIIVLLDVLNICLVYVNRIGISHPVQTFSYAVRLRVEFIVLNQLTAVAGQKSQQERFKGKRYHRPSNLRDEWDVEKPPGKRKNTKMTCPTCLQVMPSDTFRNPFPSVSVPDPIFLTIPQTTCTKNSPNFEWPLRSKRRSLER